MIAFLKKPHPFIFNVLSVAIPCISTFLIIAILAPLQFQELEIVNRLFIAFVIAVVVGICIVGSVGLYRLLLPSLSKPDTWTVGKELALIFTTIFFIMLVVSVVLFVSGLTDESFITILLKTTGITLGVSIFPVIILVLFEQYRHERLQFKKASSLTERLQTENEQLRSRIPEDAQTPQIIAITSEKNELVLQLAPTELICIKSEGNYLEIYFLKDGTLHKKLVRNRLKNLEVLLPEAVFFRCHNSYIINGKFIVTVTGNARNLELSLRGIKTPVPVSRSRTKTITTFLNQLGKA